MTAYPCPVDGCDRPRRGSEQICGACQAEIATALAAVPALAAELDITLARLGSRIAAGRSTTIPLPYHPGASEAADVLRSALVGWVREIRREGEPWPADTPASMAAWLSARHSALTGHAAAKEAHGEITAAVRAAQRAIDRPPGRVYAGPCTQCSTPLYATAGAPTVTCRSCGTGHSVEERREWMLDALQDHLAPAHQVAHILAQLVAPVRPDRVRQWAARGRIVPHGRDAAGRPLYRVGDALELLLATTRQRPGGARPCARAAHLSR